MFEAYRKEILRFIKKIREKHIIYSEIEGICNKKDYDSPADSIVKDIDSIQKCDIFILHYPEKTPTSALIELGFAIAYGKRIIIITPDAYSLPYLAIGIPTYCRSSSIIESEDFNQKAMEQVLMAIEHSD